MDVGGTETAVSSREERKIGTEHHQNTTPLGINYATFKSWFESYRHSSIDGQRYVVGLDHELGFSYSIAQCSIDIVVDDTSFNQIIISPRIDVNPNATAEQREERLQTVQQHLIDLTQAAGDQFPIVNKRKQAKNLVALADKLNNHFDDGELNDLCFRLGEDYENIKGDTKQEKARELVKYLDRRGRIKELIELCRQLRSEVSWNANPKESKD